MYIKIEKENGERVTEYGATDFQVDENQIIVFTNMEEVVYENSSVVSGLEESVMDEQGIYESLFSSLDEGDIRVSLGRIPKVDEAYKQFKQDVDKNLNFSEIERK